MRVGIRITKNYNENAKVKVPWITNIFNISFHRGKNVEKVASVVDKILIPEMIIFSKQRSGSANILHISLILFNTFCK
jgi:hypothetical protein